MLNFWICGTITLRTPTYAIISYYDGSDKNYTIFFDYKYNEPIAKIIDSYTEDSEVIICGENLRKWEDMQTEYETDFWGRAIYVDLIASGRRPRMKMEPVNTREFWELYYAAIKRCLEYLYNKATPDDDDSGFSPRGPG